MMKMNREDYFNFSNTPLVIERCLLTHVVHSPPSSYIANNVAICIVNVLLTIAGTILNSLVVFSFYKSTKLRSKVCHFATMVLCSTDLVVVVVVHPLEVHELIREVSGAPLSCLYELWSTSVILILLTVSGLNLFLTNIERYLAILHPLWHRVNVTKRRFLFSCVCFWLYGIVWIVSVLFSSFARRVFLPFHVVVLCCATTFIYLSIFRVVSKSSSLKIKPLDRLGSHKIGSGQMTLWREFKIARSYFLVVSLTFICYIPSAVRFVRRRSWYDAGKTYINLTDVNGYYWATTFSFLMSTLNCVIFFWSNRGLRKEGNKIIAKCLSRRDEA